MCNFNWYGGGYQCCQKNNNNSNKCCNCRRPLRPGCNPCYAIPEQCRATTCGADTSPRIDPQKIPKDSSNKSPSRSSRDASQTRRSNGDPTTKRMQVDTKEATTSFSNNITDNTEPKRASGSSRHTPVYAELNDENTVMGELINGRDATSNPDMSYSTKTIYRAVPRNKGSKNNESITNNWEDNNSKPKQSSKTSSNSPSERKSNERSSDSLRTSNVRTCAECKIVDCKQPCNSPRSSVIDNSRSSNVRNSAQSRVADSRRSTLSERYEQQRLSKSNERSSDSLRTSNVRPCAECKIVDCKQPCNSPRSSVVDNSRSSNVRNSAQSRVADSRRSSYTRNSVQSKVLPREDSSKSSPKPKTVSPCCCCCCQARTKQETSKVVKSPLSTPPIKKKKKIISQKSSGKAKPPKEPSSDDGIWFNCTMPMRVNLPNICIQDICNAINDQTATSSTKMGTGQNAAFAPNLCICINTAGSMNDARQPGPNATPPALLPALPPAAPKTTKKKAKGPAAPRAKKTSQPKDSKSNMEACTQTTCCCDSKQSSTSTEMLPLRKTYERKVYCVDNKIICEKITKEVNSWESLQNVECVLCPIKLANNLSSQPIDASSKNKDKDEESDESQSVTMNDDKYQSQANRASCVCLLNSTQKPQVCIKPSTCPFMKAKREAHDEKNKPASINSKEKAANNSRSPTLSPDSSISNSSKGHQPSEEVILEECHNNNSNGTCPCIIVRHEGHSSPLTSDDESKPASINSKEKAPKNSKSPTLSPDRSIPNSSKSIRQPSEELIVEKCYHNSRCIKPTTCPFIKARRETHSSPNWIDEQIKPASINSKGKAPISSRSPTLYPNSSISNASKGIRQPSEEIMSENCDDENNNGCIKPTTCPFIKGRRESHSSSLTSDEEESKTEIHGTSIELEIKKYDDDNNNSHCIKPTTCPFIKTRREAHSTPRTSFKESKPEIHAPSIEREIKEGDDDNNNNHCIKPTTCPFIKGRRDSHSSPLTSDKEMKPASINSKEKSQKSSRSPTLSSDNSISNSSTGIRQPSKELILEECDDDNYNGCIDPTTCPFIKGSREAHGSTLTSDEEMKPASINSKEKSAKSSRSPTLSPMSSISNSSKDIRQPSEELILEKCYDDNPCIKPATCPFIKSRREVPSSPRTSVKESKPEIHGPSMELEIKEDDNNNNYCIKPTTCPFIRARGEAHSAPRTSVEKRNPASINSKKKVSKNSKSPTSHPNDDDNYNGCIKPTTCPFIKARRDSQSSPRRSVEKREPATTNSKKKTSKNSRSLTSYPNDDGNYNGCIKPTKCPFIKARRDSQSSPRASVEKREPATTNSKKKAPKSSRSPTSYAGSSTSKGKRTLSGEQRNCICDQESSKRNSYKKTGSNESSSVEPVTTVIDFACEDDDESCCCCNCESITEKEQTISTTSSKNSLQSFVMNSSLTNTNADEEQLGLSQNSKVPTNTATQKAPQKQANKYPYCWNAVLNREMPPDKCYQNCRFGECGTCETTNMCTEMDINCIKINTAKLQKAYPCNTREIIHDPFLGHVPATTRPRTLSPRAPNPYMYLESMSMPGGAKVKSKSINRIGSYENFNLDQRDRGKKIARFSKEQSTQYQLELLNTKPMSTHLSNKKENTVHGITMYLSSQLGAAATPTTKLKESLPNNQENKDEKRHLNTFLIPEVNSQMVQQPTRPIKQPTVIPLSDKLSRKRIGSKKTELRKSHYHVQQSEEAATHRQSYNGSYEAFIDAELKKCGFTPKVTYNSGLKGGSEPEPSYDSLSRSRTFDDTITENECNSYSATDNECEGGAEEHSVAHVPYRVQSDRQLRQPFRREDVEGPSGHEQSQQAQSMHQPRITNHLNQNHSIERSASVPSEPEIQNTVLLEASTTCGMQNIISACAGPPNYLTQLLYNAAPFVSSQPIWMQEQQPELQYSQKQEQRNNVEINNNIDESAEWIDPRAQLQMQCMSQSTMSYQSENSIFQEPCMNNNDNIAVFQQNCDYDPNVKMPGAQVQHIPVGFYKQTVDKYGIIPMDSYFQDIQAPNNFNYSLQTPSPSLNIEYSMENVQPSGSTICGTTYDSNPHLCEHHQQHYHYQH